MDQEYFLRRHQYLSRKDTHLVADDDARLTDVQCRAGPEDVALKNRPAKEACVIRWTGGELGDSDGLYFWRHSVDATLV